MPLKKKNEGQKGKTGPVWELVPVGRGEGHKKRVKESEYGGNITYSCMKMQQ
jgi:hypothetical protein